jgi:KipI family sensor histidine kinase inhibitor
MHYRVAAVDAIVIYFAEVISEEVSDRVLTLYHHLKASPIGGVVELIPSYTTLYVQFDLLVHRHKELFARIQTVEKALSSQTIFKGRTITIPAYFDPSVGWDLEQVAHLHGLTIGELITLYTQKTYRVYTIGFAPGYAYMGSVDARIATPRLGTPRAQVPTGSVAMANAQCAVYPMASAGGWNILGRTATVMFDRSIEGFSYLQAGDRVRFEPISRETFVAQGGVV